MTTVRTTSELQHFVQQRTLSQAAFERAKKVMPSGVAHDLRYVAPFPITLARASGARKWDLDGNEYLDYHFGSAALLLGHAHPDVVAAMVEAAQRGYHYAQAHPLEPEWGELIQRLVPSVERLRFVNSGTEATYLAMRVARAYTGKPKILRFEGHYHGWHDYSVVGMSPPFDKPTSTGIPEALFESMVILPANDPAAVERALDADSEIGTVIVEASGSSWSTVPLKPGFLQALRDITTKRGKVLIFDEVITGFRWSKGGAQVKEGITPDLTTMAKIASGGMPGGVVGGRAEVMNVLEWTGDAERDRFRRPYHAGTFNANPVTAAAAIATLKIAGTGEPQAHADKLAAQLRDGINEAIKRLDISAVCYGESSTFHLYVGPRPAGTPVGETLWTDDAAALKGMPGGLVSAIRRAVQNRGIDLMSYVGGVLSSAHTPADVDQTIGIFEDSLRSVREENPEFFPA